MKEFLDVKKEFFHLFGYSMSYIEFTGVAFGLIAVWLSAKAQILSWPIGIINVILAAILYYQVQLYPDMFLQVFFFVTNIIGWWRWANPKPTEADRKQELKVSYMKRRQAAFTIIIAVAGTFMLGQFASNLHQWFPRLFSQPSAYPYIDSFITVMSVLATFYMIEKKIESWILWIIIDIVATVLYFIKGVKFYSLEYLIFTIIATYGLLHWAKEYKSYSSQRV